MAVSRKHVVNEVLVLGLVIHPRLPKFHHRLSDALFHTPMKEDDTRARSYIELGPRARSKSGFHSSSPHECLVYDLRLPSRSPTANMIQSLPSILDEYTLRAN